MQNDNLTDESSDSENSDSDDDEGKHRMTDWREVINPNWMIFSGLNGRYKNVSQLEWDNTTM